MTLFVLSMVAGALIALGGLALLWQQKIYIDAQTKEVTQIDLPFGIKLRTPAPVIAIIFMACALILVPVMKHKEDNIVAIQGHVDATQELEVYAVAAEELTRGDVQLQVPGNARYKVIYLPKDGASAIETETVDLVKSHKEPFLLRGLQVPQIVAGNTASVPATPIHTETPSVVSQFK